MNGYYVYLDINICVQNCPDGEYENTNNQQCEPCADGCLTCFGPTTSTCETCGNNTGGSMFYKVIGYTICSQTCPKGQFIHADVPYECQQCAVQCDACEI